MIVKINTHPIVVGQHEEYHIDWCGKLADTHPKLENGIPTFLIRGKNGMVIVNTINMKQLEQSARKLTNPCGKGAVTTDKAYIYIMEEDNKRTLLGVVTHFHIREYRRMFDEFECI